MKRFFYRIGDFVVNNRVEIIIVIGLVLFSVLIWAFFKEQTNAGGASNLNYDPELYGDYEAEQQETRYW